jgi:hypothetical protein
VVWSHSLHSICRVDNARSDISVTNPLADGSEPPKDFTFDGTYGTDSIQSDIYKKTAASIIESVLEGFNGTLFAYGQVRESGVEWSGTERSGAFLYVSGHGVDSRVRLAVGRRSP